MEKLVFSYQETDGYTYSYDKFVTFEYSSKDDFLFDVFEKWKEVCRDDYSKVKILNFIFKAEDLEYLEQNVITLEEWFNNNKTEYEKNI